jgi:hypothetical protein
MSTSEQEVPDILDLVPWRYFVAMPCIIASWSFAVTNLAYSLAPGQATLVGWVMLGAAGLMIFPIARLHERERRGGGDPSGDGQRAGGPRDWPNSWLDLLVLLAVLLVVAFCVLVLTAGLRNARGFTAEKSAQVLVLVTGLLIMWIRRSRSEQSVRQSPTNYLAEIGALIAAPGYVVTIIFD